MYEIPCPESEVQNHIHKVHEKRTSVSNILMNSEKIL